MVLTLHTDAACGRRCSRLVREGDGWRVYVADGGRTRARAVTVGRQGEDEVQSLQPLGIEPSLEIREIDEKSFKANPPSRTAFGSREDRWRNGSAHARRGECANRES